jgi:predicted phosphodiesterase
LHRTRNGASLSNTKPAKGSGQHRAWISQWLVDASEDLGVQVHQLKRDKFLAWATEREPNAVLRPSREDCDVYGNAEGLGAWTNLRAYVASQAGKLPEPTIAELGQARELQREHAYRRKLERAAGDEDWQSRRLLEGITAAIERTPPVLTDLRRRPANDNAPAEREICVHISDVHIGAHIDPDEVIGSRYNYQIAARRLALLAYQVAHYKRDRRGNAPLRLVFNGDLIESDLHGEPGIDLLVNQFDAARQTYTSLIDYLRGFYPRIRVEHASGNHDRTFWRNPGRAMNAKYDSISTMMIRSIEAVFRDCPDVSFNIPKTPYATWEMCGKRFLATHGDTVIQAGTPSKSVQLDKIYGQIWRFEASEAVNGRFDAIMIGHLHFASLFRVPGRSPHAFLNINGSVVGRSAWTQAMGFAAGPPSQCFWETTSDHAVGDFRIADLDRADDDARWDDVIPTPTPIGEAPRARRA